MSGQCHLMKIIGIDEKAGTDTFAFAGRAWASGRHGGILARADGRVHHQCECACRISAGHQRLAFGPPGASCNEPYCMSRSDVSIKQILAVYKYCTPGRLHGGICLIAHSYSEYQIRNFLLFVNSGRCLHVLCIHGNF